MLLAEELALLALRPDTGRFRIGMASDLNACLAGLLVGELMVVGAGVVGRATGGLRSPRLLVDLAVRAELPGRLRAAAAGDEPIDPRTALVLNMTGPAKLLEVVAPGRRARRRIDNALDGTPMASVGQVVRKLIEDRTAAAGVA